MPQSTARHRSTNRLRSLVAALVVLLAGSVLVPAAAQDSIQDAKDQQEELREKRLEATMQIALLDAEDEEVVAALEAAVELVLAQAAKVDASRQALQSARNLRYNLEVDLAWTATDIEQLRLDLQTLAVESYIGDQTSAFEALMSAQDINEAARRVAIVSIVTRQTDDLLDDLRAAELDYQTMISASEAAVVEAASIEERLQADLEDLEVKRERQAEIKAELDARRSDWEARLREFDAENEELEEYIRIEQLKAAGLWPPPEENPSQGIAPGATSTSGFQWPVDGRLGSGFGPRLHPILGYYRQHSGIDIGRNSANPIWAAKGGRVILAGWNGGYGNTVVVDHGDGVSTLYAHQARINVSLGQTVGRGQVLGYVGSTGLSTGPHLHFEVRVNGRAVDPLAYLP